MAARVIKSPTSSEVDNSTTISSTLKATEMKESLKIIWGMKKRNIKKLAEIWSHLQGTKRRLCILDCLQEDYSHKIIVLKKEDNHKEVQSTEYSVHFKK